ncbi:MAG: class I SAM-dependent methyltransferase [Treponema sp.]|jgi:ubiquinone/menaquinone biosynthesis C-methylase UbiE|nr:class I SAM-dependent methyltransferase [Treponema sp.]
MKFKTEQAEEPCRVGGLALTKEALDFCGFVSGSRLADIGCGSGATVRYLRAAGFDATGLDCDAAIVEQAGPHCRLGDASRLPFEAESLDGLFFECSLSQMASRQSVLAEARRILKSEGRLVISDLYFRGEIQGGFLPNAGGWKKIITEAAFSVLLFEDKSDGLAEFTAQLLWQHGRAGIKELCGCDMDELKAGRCGYFLLIAQKGGG